VSLLYERKRGTYTYADVAFDLDTVKLLMSMFVSHRPFIFLDRSFIHYNRMLTGAAQLGSMR
jgi:hypothetical protein